MVERFIGSEKEEKKLPEKLLNAKLVSSAINFYFH